MVFRFRNQQQKESTPQPVETPRPRALEYSVMKRRIDGGITKEVSYETFCKELKELALYVIKKTYILPEAQTTVTPSETEGVVSLNIMTVRPRRYNELTPPYEEGLEKGLSDLISNYGFRRHNSSY